jgi:hypothetical protein
VYFSCKITHAILTHLESSKDPNELSSNDALDTSLIAADSEFNWEKLRDGSFWMKAPDMEMFLERFVPNMQILVEAGHATPRLKVWGALDSVLRMMPQPQEIFHQPEKFLGYFISPEPPVENITRTENGISFDIPLPAEQYPLVTTYLKAAFEALPVYVGLNPGACQWTHVHFHLLWPQAQQNIMDVNSPEPHQVSPDLLREVIQQLQQNTHELEIKNRELQRRNEELSQISQKMSQSEHGDNYSADFGSKQMSLSMSDFDFIEAAQKPAHQIAQNISKLHDYMVRAHQLVTLLTAGQKATPGMKAAFHRVDWDIVKSQYPQIILESLDLLKTINKVDRYKKNSPSNREPTQVNMETTLLSTDVVPPINSIDGHI